MRDLIWPAIGRSFVKLDPRDVAHNPVMFVVEVGSVITSIAFIAGLVSGSSDVLFVGLVSFWLWFTVLFANFATAMAEGRGKAQADTLRRTQDGDAGEHRGRRRASSRCVRTSCARATSSSSPPARSIPGDGDVIEGIASVDESAITGESAPVIRESGGDRSAVTGGTRVLSDQIGVRITSDPGQTFLDRMIALVEGAERQKTPNEIALNILLAGLTIIFLVVIVTLQPFAIYSERDRSPSPS